MKGTADTVERETLGEVEESRMTTKKGWTGREAVMCLHKVLTRVDGRDWQLPKKEMFVCVLTRLYINVYLYPIMAYGQPVDRS